MANLMELEIGGTVYSFRAGFAFIREVDPMKKQKQNGMEQNVGLNVLIGGLYDGNVDDLLTCLDAMNKTEKPRATKTALEGYIEECDDIDGLFDQVKDFLSNANCTRRKARQLAEMYDKMMQKQREELLGHGESSTGNA
ncbi:MAG: tail assembly chaperone [Lachnospiraceae bacterium]|nr:tail assembly chaperone [Lachnospiraceae bacterium]